MKATIGKSPAPEVKYPHLWTSNIPGFHNEEFELVVIQAHASASAYVVARGPKALTNIGYEYPRSTPMSDAGWVSFKGDLVLENGV